MNDHRRYQPYYHVKNYKDRRYEDDDGNDLKRHYKKSNPYHQSSSSSSRRDERLNHRNYKDFSHRRSYRDDYRYNNNNNNNKHGQTKPKTYSTFSTPPPPLLSIPIPPPVVAPPPPPPLAPQAVVPHERESWIRSVKKTKTNESSEQKTQYLETMLRMPQQQKATVNASRFDRMRFADERSLSVPAANSTPTDDLINGSLHLVGDVHENGDIRAVEEILFNNDLAKPTESPEVEPEAAAAPIASGFLIDDCEDEEELPPPPPVPLVPSVTPDESVSDPLNEESRVLLLHELDDADAERRKQSKRQKRLQRKLKLKQIVTPPAELKGEQSSRESEPTSTTANLDERRESSSDWVVEYDVSVSRLTDEIHQTTNGMTEEERAEKMNLILSKIKKQQDELRKLRRYVMSVLGEEPQRNSASKSRSTTNVTQDLLLALLNQSASAGCWLCSGKLYSEIGTQSDEL